MVGSITVIDVAGTGFVKVRVVRGLVGKRIISKRSREGVRGYGFVAEVGSSPIPEATWVLYIF